MNSLDYVKGVLKLGFNLGSDWIFNLKFNLNFNSNFISNFNMNFSLVFNLAFRFLKWVSGFLKRPLLFLNREFKFLNREFKFLKRFFRCWKRSFFVFTVCVICIAWGKSDYLVEAKSVMSANTSVDMQVNTSANMPVNKSGNIPTKMSEHIPEQAMCFSTGNSSLMSGNSSLLSGNNSFSTGNNSLLSGNSSLLSGNNSLSTGNNSLSTGNNSFSTGNNSLSTGNSSLLSGNSSLLSGNSSLSSGNNNLSAERTGFIFTGDSRIRRLNLTVDLKSKKDTFVVCKSGMGYNWFVSQGLPQINNIMKSKRSIDKWVIVSGWGVNDLWNRNTYINRYKSLLKNEWKGVDLYLMSVNPVDGAMLSKYGGISSFNSGIRYYVDNSSAGIKYIDTSRVMKSKGFGTVDGLHYTESTNRLIYNTVRGVLNRDYACLSESAITMNKGAVRDISLCNSGSSKWSFFVGNKNIISAKKLGKNSFTIRIRGLCQGKTYIKVKIQGKTIKCPVKVTDKKILVTYYSYSGETEYMAEYIKELTGGDIYEIEADKIYPYKDEEVIAEARREYEENEYVGLYNAPPDLGQYDMVYLGFPVWNGRLPQVVKTFVNEAGINGKNIKPFTACNKDGLGESVNELYALCPDGIIENGIEVNKDYIPGKKCKYTIKTSLLQN